MITNNYMYNSYLTRKNVISKFFDMQILKPISDNAIQNIYHTDAVYSPKILYKLQPALQGMQTVITLSSDGNPVVVK